jgi:hypothetical protein
MKKTILKPAHDSSHRLDAFHHRPSTQRRRRDLLRNMRAEPDNAARINSKILTGKRLPRREPEHSFRQVRAVQLEHVIRQRQPARLRRVQEPETWIKPLSDDRPRHLPERDGQRVIVKRANRRRGVPRFRRAATAPKRGSGASRESLP